MALVWSPRLKAQVDRPPGLLQDLVDVSADFHEYRNTYFLADKLTGFDPATGAGAITWARHQLTPRIAFSNMENILRPFDGSTFPEGEYAVNPALPFSIQFGNVDIDFERGEVHKDGVELNLAAKELDLLRYL